MSVVVTYTSALTILETLTDNVPAAIASKRVVTHDQYNTTETVSPATLSATFEVALSGGTATIDLTALVGTNDIAVDGSGLKVQSLKFINKTGNAAVMSIGEGAANGYDGFGSLFFIELPVDGEVTVLGKDGGADISGTNKTLDLAGSGIEVAEISIVLG